MAVCNVRSSPTEAGKTSQNQSYYKVFVAVVFETEQLVQDHIGFTLVSKFFFEVSIIYLIIERLTNLDHIDVFGEDRCLLLVPSCCVHLKVFFRDHFNFVCIVACQVRNIFQGPWYKSLSFLPGHYLNVDFLSNSIAVLDADITNAEIISHIKFIFL